MELNQFTPLTEQESLELNGGLNINIGDLIDITTGNLNLTQLATSIAGALILTGATVGATLTNLGNQLKNLLGSIGH